MNATRPASERPETRGTLTAVAITRVLQGLYPPPEWATFAELITGTGRSADGRLDLFVMNTWPSKKFRSLAFEIKTTRSDFKREITDPSKRAFAERHAGECFFAVPAGLVSPGEVPDGWGLVEITQGGPRTTKIARQSAQRAVLPQAFVAALVRRSADPPPPLSPTAWLRAGQEISERDLLRIALEHYGRTHDQPGGITHLVKAVRPEDVTP